MLKRFRNQFGVTSANRFLLIFAISFVYKLHFAWHSGIRDGWQDEIAWKTFAETNGFLASIAQFDAGYPTPILKAIASLLTLATSSSYLIWHLVVLTLISGSIAFLSFSRLLNTSSAYLIAATVCSYPSFDLLLLHNLSYWTYIPLFVILTNIAAKKVNLTSHNVGIIVLLTLISAKPQILLSVLILTIYIYLTQPSSRFRLIIVLVSLVSFILVGRTSSNKIDLNLNFHTCFNFLTTFLSHFTNTLFPVLVLAIFGFSKAMNQSFLITTYFVLSSVCCIYIFRKTFIKGAVYAISVPIFLSFLLSSASLYLFANSGWSQESLLTSFSYTSLFSRHYLPIILTITFLLLLRFQSSVFFQRLLLVTVAQNFLLQIILYNRLYMPV